jgi:hypothetical protein
MEWGRKKKFELHKSFRLSIPLPVKFRLFDLPSREPSPTTIYGQIRDISIKGLCLETNTPFINNSSIILNCLRRAKLLQLEVKLPGVRNPLRLRGKVLWFNSHLPGSDYLFFTGIQITEATERSYRLWREFVAEHKNVGRTRVWLKKLWTTLSHPRAEPGAI